MADSPADKKNVPAPKVSAPPAPAVTAAAPPVEKRKPGRPKIVREPVEAKAAKPVPVPFVEAKAAAPAPKPAPLPTPAPVVAKVEVAVPKPAPKIEASPKTVEAPVPAKADAAPTAAPQPAVAKAAVPDPAPAAPAPAPVTPPPPPVATSSSAPSSKGPLFMATTAAEAAKPVTQRFQAMFGDANERTKAALEKGTKLAEELTELTKGNVEAIVASGRVAAKGAEALTQEAAEYGKKSFETATGALRSFAAAKSPVEFIQLQNEFAKSSFDSAIAEASKLSETWVKLAGDMFQPLSSRFAVAAEKIKATSL